MRFSRLLMCAGFVALQTGLLGMLSVAQQGPVTLKLQRVGKSSFASAPMANDVSGLPDEIDSALNGDDEDVVEAEGVLDEPSGEELDNLSIHVAVEPFLSALKTRYPDNADRVEVVDFFGHDEILWPICLACAELLAARVPGKSLR